ncbi:sulfatase [Verrucomicrobiota bacterium]|nr:sulfatase [Verrucomicrobiota bacterium]
MNPLLTPDSLNRRAFLCRAGASVGTAALANLLNPQWSRAAASAPASATDKWPGVITKLHHPPKVKRVIQLYMAGGPSHLETFDYKPKLAKMHGEPMPESVTKGQPIAQLQGNKQLKCFGPQWEFKKVGKGGLEISEIFPQLHSVADEMCIIRSLHTDAINHDPAHTFMNTGTLISGRPALGSWLNYGLGSEADDLPGFVVMTSSGKYGQSQPISARQWASGFLPTRFSGIDLRSKGDPVLYVKNPKGIAAGQQEDVVRTVQKLNQLQNNLVDDPEIATRIAQYEMAFRMQTSVPGLIDISAEPANMLELYGCKPGDGSFASNCLLARRLAEKGVRFIQLYHRDWDHHGSVKEHVRGTAAEVDQGMAALIKDLKQRDMLKDTLIIWNGEFGRTPMAQGSGRDHHQKGFSVWLAGGGIKGGTSFGATDEFGYHAAENVVHVNDLHATVLHLLGIDHKRLTFKFQGLDMRVTGVAGEVVKAVLA